ncbi:hypothetical protein BgAZ_109700 [Babesia gibsoni]|uniref:DUF155 domain-containing protein n=1 Tax=Babesia gibsoni TaxID=33632 RepID=A0AAD8UWM8_BABGI|nr:hypothetical protein BgAZ_109700 [Babesia gibsoni]
MGNYTLDIPSNGDFKRSNRVAYATSYSAAPSASSAASQSRESINTRQVSAHMVALNINAVTLKEELEAAGAILTKQDNFTLVERFPKIGHDSGSIYISHNGILVLWHAANTAYSSYREILRKHIITPLDLPNHAISSFSESMDIIDGEQSCVQKGALHLSKNYTTAEQTAVSLALMSAVQVNHMELNIKLNLMISNDTLARIRKAASKKNLDRLTEHLFEFQTYAHKTRYWLNLEYDPLEIPDKLWDNENLCNLFMATQVTFDLPQRLEKLNQRISWELDSLQSHSEYIRHKHSSRLEKIIILVITFELALGLGQALYKVF